MNKELKEIVERLDKIEIQLKTNNMLRWAKLMIDMISKNAEIDDEEKFKKNLAISQLFIAKALGFDHEEIKHD